VLKPLVQPTRAQLIMQHVFNKLRKSTLLFNSRRPAQPSLVQAVPNLNPTRAQRIIRDVCEKIRHSTFLLGSHRQPPSSLFVMVRPPNPSPPFTDTFGGAGGKSTPTPTRAQSIIRHVFQELGKQHSLVIPSVIPQRPYVASRPRSANCDSSTHTVPSLSLQPTPHLPPPCVPVPGLGIGVLARVKGWFMQARYSPNHIPDHQRRVNFLEDE
jgi:hypothetical protein